jgi:L-lactate utilization protein LutB
MEKPIERYWEIRLDKLKIALEANNFTVYRAENAAAAGRILIETVLPETGAKTVSWGGSLTAAGTGVHDVLRNRSELDVIDAFERGITLEESLDRRRRAFSADLYLTGTNAVTETGQLVNLDRTGNRVAALTFGPRHVVVFVGRNKLVGDLKDAFFRIKNYAAPVNAMRLDAKTPCVTISHCDDCRGPERLCNSWVITEKSFPKGRIKIVLINQDIGF